MPVHGRNFPFGIEKMSVTCAAQPGAASKFTEPLSSMMAALKSL